MNSVSERSVLAVRIAKFGLLLLFSVRKPKEEFCAFLASREGRGLQAEKWRRMENSGLCETAGPKSSVCLFVCFFWSASTRLLIRLTNYETDTLKFFENATSMLSRKSFTEILHLSIATIFLQAVS